MKTTIFIAACLAMVAGPTLAAAASSNDAHGARHRIEQVITRFQAAIIKKDKAALTDLFLPTDNSWMAVPTETTYRLVKARHPKAPRFMPGSYGKFVDFVSTSPGHMEEKFSNVKIETDGAVASVYFDFVFLDDGKPENRGSETWQLINTGHGWKINALAYSINVDPGQVK